MFTDLNAYFLGQTSSPFILNATLDKHLKQFSDPVAERIREDIYVDDLVSGAGDDTEAVPFYTSARTLMTPGGFNMRSWASNKHRCQIHRGKGQPPE